MKKTNSRIRNSGPVFQIHGLKKEESAIPEALLKQAKKSGKLNLSNRHLICVPEEVLRLSEVHSDNCDVRIDNSDSDSNKWWECEPLQTLDLSNNCITNIPTKINHLDTLTTLYLHFNNLTSVPPEFGHLYKLSKLDMSNNKLTNLPIELSGLKELKYLKLMNNSFTTIPDCIYDLVMLNYLDLSQNKITSMPPGIGFLSRLTQLDVSHNQLPGVPSDLLNCKALLELDLSNNVITSEGLPFLNDLHRIEKIQLQYNKLTILPKIYGCSNLKEIHLAYNLIKTLKPDDEEQEITIEELSTLSHLETINLRANKLENLPKELSCLQNLVRLDLTDNNLKELPATLGLLPHLTNLLVERNELRAIRRDIISGGTTRLLKYLRDTIPLSEEDKNLVAKLPCSIEDGFPNKFTMRSSRAVSLAAKGLCNIPDEVFEEAVQVPCNMVDLSKNKLSEVPAGVWSLKTHLVDLNLSKNQIKLISDAVGECLALQHLNLEGNQLESLPDALKNCTKLREINISFNRFHEIPESLFSITHLEILMARDNKISCIEADKLLNLKRLATLELSNNNISAIPPALGNMVQIRCLGLEGNGLRAPRPAILAKGTEAILSWLRDKIVVH